jgi:hypothetical protein
MRYSANYQFSNGTNALKVSWELWEGDHRSSHTSTFANIKKLNAVYAFTRPQNCI